MLQLGLFPSHFSFLFLHIIQANRFGLGTLALPVGRGAASPVPSALGLLSLFSSSERDAFWLECSFAAGIVPGLRPCRGSFWEGGNI